MTVQRSDCSYKFRADQYSPSNLVADLGTDFRARAFAPSCRLQTEYEPAGSPVRARSGGYTDADSYGDAQRVAPGCHGSICRFPYVDQQA
ncbi:MAG TPA: hypothetical protein VLL08_11465 [Kineosporiaceae bacterium]|nr:hypothetical protein [Kineosporiaceae bacterium]